MSTGHRVVVVEDHADIRELLVMVLDGAGLEVHEATTGEEALALVAAQRPDLVTLDLSLPDMDGVDVCKRIREFSDAYIVMITGRTDEIDRLVGLEVGADDYLSKPFSPREVRARCEALLRRPRISEAAPATAPAREVAPGLVLDAAAGGALLAGEALPLTPPELEVLTVLASRPGHVWTRGDLVREVWQGEFIEGDFLVDVHVGNLRRKMRRAGGSSAWIRTVAGTSYAFTPDDPAE